MIQQVLPSVGTPCVVRMKDGSERFEGTVYPIQSWQKGRDVINLTTGLSWFPWREIPLRQVQDIALVGLKAGELYVMVAGSSSEHRQTKIQQVAGSKGNLYTIIETNGRKSCDCAGFTYRGHCKHTDAK